MKFVGYEKLSTLKLYTKYSNFAKKMKKWLDTLDVNLIECMYDNKRLEQKPSLEKDSIPKLEKLQNWFGSVPRFTTIRTNPATGSSDTIIEIIKTQLQEQAASRGRKTLPEVKQDPLLKDCVVVSCWDEQSMNSDRQSQEVIVDVKCGVAILRGADLFAPGVIAMSSETTIGSKVSVYADLAQKCLWGRTTPYSDLENKMFVGNGIALMTRKDIFAGSTKDRKTGRAIEMTDIPSRVSSISLPPKYGILQNYPSILCSHVLNPQPGDIVLDMCASPGNKTTHLASLMKHEGTLIALDRSKNKVEKLDLNCRLQGCDWVRTYAYNSIEAVDKQKISNIDGPPPYPKNSFDKILLDAPCSALGQRPHINTSMTAKHINSYPIMQKRLFDTAVSLLKPGGVLVYSTCTILVQENEGLVEWALNTYPGVIELVRADPLVGSSGTEWPGSQLTSDQRKCLQRFGPDLSQDSIEPHQSDTIGFFIAKFRKIPT
ncbi:hypothetical protein LSTR_LSTR000395 [Laodelphax striatellus]|uniref:SAM-dependent MTase RsmB/NOP-type domain-containing protein n=1 Tax=Laodelphax striatellus TaxID=195883 RepID=A0A482X4I7_LAOST|nr:hypothetical protein LSTR_LSTR000395 [Laodelphax striatellus]